MKHYVIIGNGVAAVGCIEGIRRVDTETPITVVSEERHPVYGRPLISYYLEGKTTLDKMSYRKPDFYEKNGCRVLYGKKAEAISVDTQEIRLNDGCTLPYTSLCVATGSSPFIPPIRGLESASKVFTFMTWDDTLALEQALTPSSRVLIVGAGLIGLKCAEGLLKRVGHITVCDLADRVLSSVFDTSCAAILQRKLEENGIEFRLGDTVSEIDGHNATMKSGATLGFDILVLAVGVRPNTALIKACGGTVRRGIRIDERSQTSLPAIYAAGDCAEGMDRSLNEARVLAILPNAYQQGHAAGVNMAGGNEIYDQAIPMNAIGFFGLHAVTAGRTALSETGGEIVEEKGEETFKRFYLQDGYLVGFVLIGSVDRAGIYTALVRNRVRLDSVDFALLKKSPTLLAYSQNSRRKMLGGVV